MVKKFKNISLTPTQAINKNKKFDNAAYMLAIGDNANNPEFLYPEELIPSVVTTDKKENDYKQATKEASIFRDRSLVGSIGAGRDQNLGDKSLQNIAALSIGIPLIATNPATAPILENATKDILHAGKVLLDPTKAITGVGQAASTTADIYGTIEGLRHVPNATKNIIQGNGTAMDYFNLVTGLMGPFGTFNVIKGARFSPYLRQVAGYKNLSLDDGDRLLNTELPPPPREVVIENLNSRPSTISDADIDEIRFLNRRNIRTELHDVSDVSREQIRRNLGFNEDIDIDFDDEGTMIVSGRRGRINESGSSVTNDINELRQQDDEINAIISRNTPRFQPLFPEVYERNAIREIRDKNLLGRYIELKTGKTLSDIADNYVLVDLQPVPISEIKTIMRNKGFSEEFINFSLQNFAESVRSAIDNPIKANNIRGFNYHKFEPDFRTGTQAFKLNKVRANPETGIKHIFENYFRIREYGNKAFNDISRINTEDKEILDELISLYNNRTSSNLSFNDLNDVDKFADFRNFLRTLWSDKKFPGDINSMAWSDAEGFGEFKPFSTPSNYDAMKILSKSEDILNRIPRGYSMAVDDTSYDSEMLKLLKVIKNKDKYGRKAGQYSVESLGTSSWGNDFHKEQIRIGDILNEYRDKLSQSDIDYIESIINRNPNGKPSQELVNIIKDKYDLLGDKLAKNLHKTWGKILDIDPSLNIDREIIRYEPFNEHSVFSDIIRKGKATPRIYRPDIRIHHNKLGGKHKFKFGGMKQDKVFKLKGGVAIPLDNKKRLFYLSGAKHEQGGIDITPELEAEGGEVVKINPKSIKVVTAQKIMGGKSPAELVVDASSTGKSEKVFNKVFNYQENFKDRHNLNDDGTKKAKWGIIEKIKNSNVGKQILDHLKFETFFNNEDYDPNIVSINDRVTEGEYDLYPISNNSRYNKNNFYKKNDEIVYDSNWDSKSDYMQYKGYEPLNYDELRKMLPKRDYIGGSKRDVGIKVIDKVPGMKDEILRLSELYDISPNVFTNRLINEGWVQDQAKLYNMASAKHQKEYNWDRMNDFVDGFNALGLDTFGDHHKAGHLNLRRNIEYDDHFTMNEDDTGRTYNSADFKNMYDALEAKAAMIEYLTKLGKKKGHTGSDLDAWVNAAYNMGEYHKDLNNMDYVRRKYGVKPYYRYGGQMKNKKKAKLGAADLVNIGVNSAGALTNLITGLTSPDIKYARMKDPIPVIAPKINSNVNTTAEENAIDQAYYDEIRSINENTANSKVALNRIRNAGAKRAASKVKIRSAAENISRDLINKGNVLKGEYDKFNIQRQEQVDAYNRQAKAAEFNANRTKVGDAITGFVSDLSQGASTITNTLERREADRVNTVLSYMGNPEVNPNEFGKGFDEIYEKLYGRKPSRYIRKKYNKK